jgi:hypothetical protein
MILKHFYEQDLRRMYPIKAGKWRMIFVNAVKFEFYN